MILHVADVHLGYRAFDRKNEFGVNLREADIYRAWRQFIEAAIKRKPSLVLVAGDLFDNPNPPIAAIIAAQDLWLLECPVLIIMGNHERPLVGELSPIHVLNKNNVSVFTTPTIHVDDQGNTIFCAPDTGVSYPFPQAKLLLAHGQIQGPDEYMHQTNHMKFDAAPYLYCALGDLHHFWKKDNMYYPGCLTRLTFAQEANICGYLEVDLATHHVTQHSVFSRSFVTITDEASAQTYLATPGKDEVVRIACDLKEDIITKIREKSLSLKTVRQTPKNSVVGPGKNALNTTGCTLDEDYVQYSKDNKKDHLIDAGLKVIKGV